MNDTKRSQIKNLVELKTPYVQYQKIFEYIEIEYNLRLRSKKTSDYYNWLENSRNDNFFDRTISPQYGNLKIEIFVYKDNEKRRLSNHKITKILNIYGKRGYEVIGVRETVDKDRYPFKKSSNGSRSFERRDHYFYQQTIYTLKKEVYVDLDYYQDILNEEEILSDEYETEQKENIEQEINNDNVIEKDQDPLSVIPLLELQLSARTYKCLKRLHVNSILDLTKYSPEELAEVRNFGQRSIDEIIDALHEKLGITLSSVS